MDVKVLGDLVSKIIWKGKRIRKFTSKPPLVSGCEAMVDHAERFWEAWNKEDAETVTKKVYQLKNGTRKNWRRRDKIQGIA